MEAKLLERTETNVVEAKRRAAEQLALRTPAELALADAMRAKLLSKLVRAFVGVEEQAKSKGHAPVVVLPVNEFRAFRAEHPATHRWAEWEKSLDLGV